MKKYIILIAFIIIVAACNRSKKVVEETYAGGSPKVEKYYIGEGTSKELVKEIRYYSNKQIQMEGEYKDSLRKGEWVYYYDNGNKWSECSYIKGVPEGKTSTYFENGKKRYDGYYKDGKRSGKWEFWDEKGIFWKEIDYDKADTTDVK